MTTAITLLVFVFMIVSFCLNKIPMAVTSMAGALILVISGCVEPSQLLSNIGSTTVLTMGSMFIVSGGLRRTSMIPKMSQMVNKVSGGSFTRTLLGYVIITFILGQFIPSITALFALVCPLALAMCDECGFSRSKMMYPIGLVAVATSYAITPIGPYVGNYIENNGYLEEYGIVGFENTIFTEMSIKLPVAIIILLWAVLVAPRLAPDKPEFATSITFNTKKEDRKPLGIWQERIMYLVFISVVISLLCDSFGQPVWLIPAIGACIVICSGIMTDREAISNMGTDIILLYVGVVTLGNAFSSTQAGELIGNTVTAMLGNTTNSYIIGGVFFLASFIMSSLLYNRAVGKILVPIALVTCKTLGCDPRGIIQMCYIGSMSSLITPMATTVVPMMMGAGGYSAKTLVKMGWLTSLMMLAATVLVGMTLYPCF